jgi:hypothetical protein
MRLQLGTLTRLYAHIDPDPEVVRSAVSAWRHWLNKELPHALDWNESPTAPFESAEVGEADWAALCAGAGEQLTRPELWLPGEHDFLFIVGDLSERQIWVGSSAELQRELENMQEATPGREILLRLARRSLEFDLPLARLP